MFTFSVGRITNKRWAWNSKTVPMDSENDASKEKIDETRQKGLHINIGIRRHGFWISYSILI